MNALKNAVRKLTSSHRQFSILIIITLLGSIFFTINTLQQNQDQRSRAATVPGTYGYGSYGDNAYGVIPSVPTTPTNTPSATTAPTPTTGPTATPTPTGGPTPTMTPTPIPVNLALNRPVTAESIYGRGYDGSKAVDGNTDTYWISKYAPNWIKIDLGSLKTVSKFVIKHFGGTYTTKNFSIQTSTDNATWTTVINVTNNNASITTSTISPRSARYIRLNVTTPAQNTYPYAIIRELEIYGSAGINPTPTMAATPTPTSAPTPTNAPTPTSGPTPTPTNTPTSTPIPTPGRK